MSRKDELLALAETMDWLWYNDDRLDETERLDGVIDAVGKLARALAATEQQPRTDWRNRMARMNWAELVLAIVGAFVVVHVIITGRLP